MRGIRNEILILPIFLILELLYCLKLVKPIHSSSALVQVKDIPHYGLIDRVARASNKEQSHTSSSVRRKLWPTHRKPWKTPLRSVTILGWTFG